MDPGPEPETSLPEEGPGGSTVVGGTSTGRFPGVEARGLAHGRPTRESAPCLGRCVFLLSHRTPRSLTSAVCCSPVPCLWVPGSVEVGRWCRTRPTSQLSEKLGTPAWGAWGESGKGMCRGSIQASTRHLDTLRMGQRAGGGKLASQDGQVPVTALP